MTRHAEIWRSELIEVQSLLNTRFDKQALDTKAAMNLLDELLDAPVAVAVPDISATLSALVSAERTLSIPSDAAQAQEAQQAKEAIGGATTAAGVNGEVVASESESKAATPPDLEKANAQGAVTETDPDTGSGSNSATNATGQGN